MSAAQKKRISNTPPFFENRRSYRKFLKNLVTKISIKVNLDSYYGKNSDEFFCKIVDLIGNF